MAENERKRTWGEIFYDYWSGDHTREGYEQGFRDGEQGRTAKPAGYHHIRPLNFIWATDNAMETYSEAYKKGYDDGLRKRHNLYSSPIGGNMGDQYRYHIAALDQFGDLVTALENAAQLLREDYRRQLNYAANNGMMNDYVQALGGARFNAFSHHIDRLLEIIERSRREIDKQKRILENLALQARDDAQ